MNLQAKHTITKEDIIESVLQKNKFMNRLLDLFFLVFSILGLYYFIQGLKQDVNLEFYVLSFILILSPVLVHYLMIGVTYLTGSLMYKLQQKTMSETEYVLKSDTFQITNEYGVSKMTYAQLQRVSESNSAYYFYINRLVFFIVSKKALGLENSSILRGHLETVLTNRQNRLKKNK